MNDDFVVDSSIAVGWVHVPQSDALAVRLLNKSKNGSTMHVPSLWRLEVSNALLAMARRKVMLETDRLSALNYLGRLKVVVDFETSSRAFSNISDLAAKYGLSVYDAAYLELAQRTGLPLGSRDKALREAAAKSGVILAQ